MVADGVHIVPHRVVADSVQAPSLIDSAAASAGWPGPRRFYLLLSLPNPEAITRETLPGRLWLGCQRCSRLRKASEHNMIKVIKPVLAIAVLAVLIAVSASCSGAPNAVRMGTEGAYPPYNFIDDDGEVGGFERELGDELCRRASLECVWVTNEWDSIIPNLVAGDYDTILAGMSITDERDEVIDFTQPYLPPSPSVYVAMTGAGDEVVNDKVAAQVSTIQSGYLSQSGATLVEYPLAEELVAAVLSGEADAILVDREFARDSVMESGGRLSLVGPEVSLGFGVGVGIRESDSRLKGKLDRAINAMKEDGSLNVLIKKWFGPDAETF